MNPASLFARCRRGSVTVLAAVAFPVLIGTAGLVTEYGDALLTKVKLQRIADAAAYSGALAYNAGGGSTTALGNAVSRITTLNGMATSAAVGSVVSSPKGNGFNAVRVVVSDNVTLGLSKMIRDGSNMAVSATAFVELRTTANGIPCIIALNGAGTGVTLSGGTSLSAPNCAVKTNASITVPNGTSVTTPVVTYNSATAPSATTISNIHPPVGVASVSITRAAVSDPLAGSAGVTAATSRLTSVSLMAGPSAPTVSSGTALAFDWTATGKTFPGGCNGSFASGTWTVTCTGAGPFNFGAITLGGGITVNVNNSTTATYNFSGVVNNSGTALRFNGAGTYNLAQGLTTGGGTTTTFGAGTFNLGQNAASCNGAARYSICHTGTTLSFAGPSTFVLSSGIYNSGGSTLTFGSGTSNSYRIGPSSNNNALWAGGGSKTKFADATAVGGLFEVVGMLNIASGGGSCVTLPAAANHDINGNFSTAGGTFLGAGTYTINGYAALGANGGGDVTCDGTNVGISGAGVTFVLSAAATIASGTCSGTAFCVAAGYGNVTLTAPSTGTLKHLLVVGPTVSTNTAGATFAEGAATSLSGAFYIPWGPFYESGGASVGNGTGQCLEVIASQVTLTGGTTLASVCPGLAGTSTTSGAIALVQ